LHQSVHPLLPLFFSFFRRDEALNTTFSASEFSLDEGERLLKGMQELREELNAYGDVVTKLAQRAKEIVPMKQRRMPVTKPMPVVSICAYKQANVSNCMMEILCSCFDGSGPLLMLLCCSLSGQY